MNTIRELKAKEKYDNMLKRKNKVINELLSRIANLEYEVEHLNKIIEDFDLFIDGLANHWKITGQELYDKWNEIKSQNIKKKTIVNNNTMISLNGKNFHCTCGANVFTLYSDDTFECHGCGNEYK